MTTEQDNSKPQRLDLLSEAYDWVDCQECDSDYIQELGEQKILDDDGNFDLKLFLQALDDAHLFEEDEKEIRAMLPKAMKQRDYVYLLSCFGLALVRRTEPDLLKKTRALVSRWKLTAKKEA